MSRQQKGTFSMSKIYRDLEMYEEKLSDSHASRLTQSGPSLRQRAISGERKNPESRQRPIFANLARFSKPKLQDRPIFKAAHYDNHKSSYLCSRGDHEELNFSHGRSMMGKIHFLGSEESKENREESKAGFNKKNEGFFLNSKNLRFTKKEEKDETELSMGETESVKQLLK
jgi:hypothetical protein